MGPHISFSAEVTLARPVAEVYADCADTPHFWRVMGQVVTVLEIPSFLACASPPTKTTSPTTAPADRCA
jgi:hypothetical protein